MAYLDDLESIRDNLAATVKNETARWKTITAAGGVPPITYSLDGESYDFNGWIGAMLDKIKAIDDLLQVADDPFELPMQGI